MADLSKVGPFGLNGLTATAASRKLESGEITSEALVSDCLLRIKERNTDVNAWAFIDPERALEQARAIDKIPRRSPLHGVPIGIKDVFDTQDMPTGHGFKPYKGKMWHAESKCVSLLRDAGLLIFGKTITTEFACPQPIGTMNPHNFERTASVSSSGSAAAVADYMVTLANGTQTGGSVIGPAASNGVYGFKASLDGIDRTGFRHCKPSIDTIGLFARSIDDLILLRSINTGQKRAAHLDVEIRPRIAIVRTASWSDAERCVQNALNYTISVLEKAGAYIEDVQLPRRFDDLINDFSVVNAWEGRRALAMEVKNNFSEFNGYNRERIRFSDSPSEKEFLRSSSLLNSARAKMDKLASNFDLFLTPSLPGEAPIGTTELRTPVYTRLWTQMYMPAINLPLFEGPNNMPVNVQLVGRNNFDAQVLLLAKWIDDRLRESVQRLPIRL